MKQVLGKLAEANVKLNVEKCLVDVTKLVTKPNLCVFVFRLMIPPFKLQYCLSGSPTYTPLQLFFTITS